MGTTTGLGPYAYHAYASGPCESDPTQTCGGERPPAEGAPDGVVAWVQPGHTLTLEVPAYAGQQSVVQLYAQGGYELAVTVNLPTTQQIGLGSFVDGSTTIFPPPPGPDAIAVVEVTNPGTANIGVDAVLVPEPGGIALVSGLLLLGALTRHRPPATPGRSRAIR